MKERQREYIIPVNLIDPGLVVVNLLKFPQ